MGNRFYFSRFDKASYKFFTILNENVYLVAIPEDDDAFCYLFFHVNYLL